MGTLMKTIIVGGVSGVVLFAILNRVQFGKQLLGTSA